METRGKSKERSFSIELTSKNSLSNVSLTNSTRENVLVEGTIGELEHAGFAEGVIMEIVGRKGVLRIEISENEMKQLTRNAEAVEKNE
jgi:hypothetical protein